MVAQITGVGVRETVPDAIFEKAYDVRLVDLPVGELLQRLLEGNVYVLERAARAVENFFQEQTCKPECTTALPPRRGPATTKASPDGARRRLSPRARGLTSSTKFDATPTDDRHLVLTT